MNLIINFFLDQFFYLMILKLITSNIY